MIHRVGGDTRKGKGVASQREEDDVARKRMTSHGEEDVVRRRRVSLPRRSPPIALTMYINSVYLPSLSPPFSPPPSRRRYDGKVVNSKFALKFQYFRVIKNYKSRECKENLIHF